MAGDAKIPPLRAPYSSVTRVSRVPARKHPKGRYRRSTGRIWGVAQNRFPFQGRR